MDILKKISLLLEKVVDSKGKEISVGDYVYYSKLKPKQEAKVVKVDGKSITIKAVTGKGVGSRDNLIIPKKELGYVTVV